ncbi:MAG: transposase [Candidatus Binatia bacterium]
MSAPAILSPVLALIFAKMTAIYNTRIDKRQRDFLSELFRVVFALQGRINFTNMARFSVLHEQTFRRHFACAFDWVAFNLVVLRLRAHPEEPLIGVFDTSFLPKSGKKTYGLDKFFSSTAKATRTGLEVSLLGVIATTSRRTFALDATQTPPDLSIGEPTQDGSSRYSRIDFYLEQITDCLARLPQVNYFVGDGYYAKRKVFDTLASRGKHLVTKLRSDANLRFLAEPHERASGGRPRRYAGKVRFSGFGEVQSRFSEKGALSDLPHVRIYTALVNSEHLKRDLRLVVLHNERDGSYVVLCSTDLNQPAEEVVTFYRLRYQLEFVIRDAKQFAGLVHCQARDQEKLDFHLNMSMAAVNLGRLVSHRASISLGSYVREAYNTFLVGRLLSELSLGAEFRISHPRIQEVIQTGRLAA